MWAEFQKFNLLVPVLFLLRIAILLQINLGLQLLPAQIVLCLGIIAQSVPPAHPASPTHPGLASLLARPASPS